MVVGNRCEFSARNLRDVVCEPYEAPRHRPVTKAPKVASVMRVMKGVDRRFANVGLEAVENGDAGGGDGRGGSGDWEGGGGDIFGRRRWGWGRWGGGIGGRWVWGLNPSLSTSSFAGIHGLSWKSMLGLVLGCEF